ncbi:MAG: polyphosphate kinase 1 [Planctomycetes bacterium]|nr:polyphosphate kinase 1 [Planctomycetota bacterium]
MASPHDPAPPPTAGRPTDLPADTRGERPAGAGGSGNGPDLASPALYLNRELSLLAFNRRVLYQAEDASIPLLERLRFLAICSTNLDEFFEIRVAGLKQQIEVGVGATAADGLSPAETLARVSSEAHELVDAQYRVFNQDLLPALQAQGIRLVFRGQWTDAVAAWARRHCREAVLPVLTPVGLDPAHPFPSISNKSLNFIVSLRGRDAFGRSSRNAIVQAPRLLPRLIRIPKDVAGSENDFLTLSGMIHEHVGELFPGMTVTGCHPFRVTRDSDLWVDEEEVDDLLRALQGELRRRNFGDAVRLEVSSSCPDEIAHFLLHHFELGEGDLYRVDGPVNLHRCSALFDLVDRPDLKEQPFVPALPRALRGDADIFDVLRAGDVLLHHPFESFAPVVELLQRAARDPAVLAIKITLYRTGTASPLTDALLEAARNGKEVTAVVELRARFDEEANIDIATRLQQAGVRVVYGIVGYKAHSKMMLLIRREGDRLRRYVHLGTGNYHPRNTRAYTDFGLLSSDEALGDDVHAMFQQLTGLGRAGSLRKLVQSPFTLHERVLELIRFEADAARAGRPSGIRAKMNSLIEPETIRALYEASCAGVPIDLVVRGICGLRPGVPGVSETIHVRSIVGRFLEHARIFDFHHDGRPVTLCASADWMPRNFFHRVETAFPIENPALRERVVEEGLMLYLKDDSNAWELLPDGTWTKVVPSSTEPFCAQIELLRRLTRV